MRSAAVLTLMFVLGASSLPGADVTLIEEIVAKVNGDVVTRTDIGRARAQIVAEIQQLRQRGGAPPQAEAQLREREKDVLRDRIDNLLLIQKAKELNINVDGDISRQLAEIQKQSGIADPEKFQAYVREQTGMLYEDYKSEMRNSLLTQRVIRQEVGSRINVPRAQVRKYYDDHKNEFLREERVFLREILVSTEGKDADGIKAAEKKAQDLVARARKGEKFHELARDNSDADTAKEFGELGGRKRDELRKEIADLIFDQPRGYVTEPIKTDRGLLILKVEEKHAAGQAAFEEVENEIMERLFTPLFQPKIREYLTQLRLDAFLEIKEGWVDSAAAPGKNTKWTDPAELKPETVSKTEVAQQSRRRRLLWVVPIPGTTAPSKSSSK